MREERSCSCLAEASVRVDATCRGPKAERERLRVAKVATTTTTELSIKHLNDLQANALPLPFSGISRSARRQRFVVARLAPNMPATPPPPHLRSALYGGLGLTVRAAALPRTG